MSNEQVFGISQEQYLKVQEATELEALYGMSREYSNIAFSIASQYSIPLKEAFRYIDSILAMLQETETAMNRKIQEYNMDHGISDAASNAFDIDSIIDEKEVRELAFSPTLLYLCIDCKVSASFAMIFIQSVPFAEEDILKIQPKIIHDYIYYDDMDFFYYLKALAYYLAHSDENYTDANMDEYMNDVASGIPIETSFAYIIPEKVLEEAQNEAMKSLNSGQFWAEEDAFVEMINDEQMAEERENWDIRRASDYASDEYEDTYSDEDDDFSFDYYDSDDDYDA